MMDAALRTALRGFLLGIYHASQAALGVLEETDDGPPAGQTEKEQIRARYEGDGETQPRSSA